MLTAKLYAAVLQAAVERVGTAPTLDEAAYHFRRLVYLSLQIESRSIWYDSAANDAIIDISQNRREAAWGILRARTALALADLEFIDGLGYNRRAGAVHTAVQYLTEMHNSRMYSRPRRAHGGDGFRPVPYYG